MARFIDPRVDWAFKRIFGSEDTKECLITFLNGLFEDELVIKDVTFAKTEKLGLRPDDRGVVFDVYCITNEDKHIIVEMQKKEQEYFADRALYYTARAIVQQGGSWNLGLSLSSSLYGVFHGLCFGESDAKGVSYRLGAYRFADTPASVRQDAYCIPPVAIVRQAYGGRVYGYI